MSLFGSLRDAITGAKAEVNPTRSQVVALRNPDGSDVGPQHPVPTNGDSVYSKDIWEAESTSVGFSGIITDLFDNLHTIMENVTATNPKELLIHFQRTTVISSLSIGAGSGDFSNIKLIIIGSGGVEFPIIDESADNTKHTSKSFELPIVGFNAIKIQFHTADTVTLSNVFMPRVLASVARIQGQRDDGDFEIIGATDNGNLKVTDAESGLAIAKGLVEGSIPEHKFGNAPDFDTSDGEITIWDGAEDGEAWEQMVYQYSILADIDSVSSSSVSDTHEVTIEGLDILGNEISQNITLNGQTRVPLITALYRNPRVYNNSAVEAVGHTITYVNTALSGGVPIDTTQIRSITDPINEQTEMVVYTVPAGKTAFMRSWYASTSGASKVSNYRIKLKSRLPGKVFRVKHVQSLSDTGTSAYNHVYLDPVKYTEMTDIEMTAQSLASPSVSGAAVSAGFDLVIVDN